MLSIDFTSSLKKNIILSLFALFALSCTFLLMIGSAYHTANPPQTLLGVDNNGESSYERIRFLTTLGYTVNASSEEEQAVQIPMEFNDVYCNYNDIQKEIGTDLYYYRGAQCTRFTYTIESENETLKVNLLVYDNRIIGGDVCTVTLGGRMEPLAVQSIGGKNGTT